MKKRLLTIAILAITSFSFGQGGNLWKTSSKKSNAVVYENKVQITNPRLYDLDINALQNLLLNSSKRTDLSAKSNLVISFPNAEGNMERFKVLETSNMEQGLADKYPEIKSYVGQGVDNPSATIYFSLSSLGLQTMTIYADQSAVFIEPYTKDLNTYTVFRKADKAASLDKFECSVIDNAVKDLNNDGAMLRPNADDGNLRTYRLAMSVTGEYTAYFGGTKALALAAINNTMTRVNGVFEKDFGVHMNLIANTDLVIYTNASTDPYSDASVGTDSANSSNAQGWGIQLQNTLTSVLGNAAYDIGHLFGATGGGGNAGCIGCVCVNDTTSTLDKNKGSGYTSPNNGIPQGDSFDIDYVVHEMGHQFGANHTFTHKTESGSIAQMEPGSGTTIMGYAGITGATDVQAHSDPFFHAISIQQVTNYIKSTTCQTTTVTGNAIPTANAGLDYTIPKGTPFMLTGSASDTNGDALTYDWEEMDTGTVTTTYPSVTATTGPAFRSFITSTSPTRYFPQLSTILTGATSWKWEAVPNVARTLNFRLTVRDNHAGGPANNSDDMVVTVNGTAGPFTVSSPNTSVSYTVGSTQTVTWAVAGTTANGVNAANVDILLSTDGGNTYPITLLAATPNDGTQTVTIPNSAGTQNRIMVKGTNHIFFDVSDTNFTITGGVVDTTAPSAPSNLIASGTTSSTTNLSWTTSTDNVGVTGYDIYQGTTFIGSSGSATYSVTGLAASTAYTFSVKAKDASGNISSSSNIVNVTTLTPPIIYCSSQGNSVADERIGKVVFGTINNSSTTSTGYTDFTSINTNVIRNSSYTITITPTWTSTTYNEGYSVWIDYNNDGDFTDSGEQVWTKAASKTTPVTGTFTIPTTATLATTRMRVSLKYNAIPTSCEVFDYGEVEDYSINIAPESCTITTTWDGTAWSNGYPVADQPAAITGNYTATADLSACSLSVTGTSVVSVPSGFDFNITGTVSVASGASLTFENNANLIQAGTANNNTGKITSKRNTTMRRLDYTYWSSPVAGQQLKAFSPQTVSPPVGASRFYILNEPTNTFDAVDPLVTNFSAAKGYSVRAPNNFPVDLSPAPFVGTFNGVPNNGNYSYAMTKTTTPGANGYNLIGNPYPSPIDASLFLATTPGTIYLWTHYSQAAVSGANYASYNTVGGTAAVAGGPTPNGIIQTGQGFMFLTSAAGNATFTNAMRVGNNAGQFFKTTSSDKSRIWLNLTSPTEAYNQILIGYMDNATNGVDESIDGKQFPTATSSISSILDNTEYVIQGRPSFTDSDIVSLGFKASTAGTYSIGIDHADGLFSRSQAVFLRDNLTGTVQNIKQNGYSFATAEGTFNGRFEVIYQGSPLANPNFDANNVIVYKANSVLNINSGSVTMSGVKIFDVRGGMIYERDGINATSASLNDLRAEQQVIIVQITSDDNRTVTKKVVY